MGLSLEDLGERAIVRELLPRFCARIGDDCAVLEGVSTDIIVTTDPVPEPAAKVLGGDPDLYWMGWLLVVINASDLAAAGASPLGFLAAIEGPSGLEVSSLERLLLGIKEGCEAEGLRYVGGNLREAGRLSAVGTAVGETGRGKAISRRGGRESDVVVSVGCGGLFWADVLTLKGTGTLVNKDSSPLFRPRSQLRVMRKLAQANLVVAAIDNSDGLLPTLDQLAAANGLRIELNLDELQVAHAVAPGIDPARLWLGWGDWNVVAVIQPQNVEKALALAEAAGGVVIPIGRLIQDEPGVLLRRGSVQAPAPRLESERFARDSWFVGGIEAYMERLLAIPLP